MFEKIFKGLERAHGCTKVSAPAENGVKLKGQSFVVRQPVTTDLWQMHLNGKQSLGIIPINDACRVWAWKLPDKTVAETNRCWLPRLGLEVARQNRRRNDSLLLAASGLESCQAKASPK